MKLIYLFFILISLNVHAQRKLPFLGIGPAPGFEYGTIDKFDISGPSMEVRLAAIFNTFPVFALGIDATYGKLTVETDNDGEITGERSSLGPMFGFMLPFELFGFQFDSLPRGSGLPFFFSFKPNDEIRFKNDLGTIKGTGYKAGTQLQIGSGVVLQFAYHKSIFDDNEGANFLPLNEDIEVETYMISVQLPQVFLYH